VRVVPVTEERWADPRRSSAHAARAVAAGACARGCRARYST